MAGRCSPEAEEQQSAAAVIMTAYSAVTGRAVATVLKPFDISNLIGPSIA